MNIIFDMDGTLIDSAKIAIPAFEKVCPQFGLDIPSDEVIIAAVGYANPEFYYRIYPDVDKKILTKFGREVESQERKIVGEVSSDMLFPGVKKLLDDLVAKGHRLFIASTGDLEHVDDCLKACNIYSLFDAVHCNKPDKEIMVENIIKNETEKSWIMIGDRRKDSKAAKHNKIASVGAAYGYCTQIDFGEFDYIIDKPEALLELLYSLMQ